MNHRQDTTTQTDPVLVRLLEQLTTYAAALDHADAPVLARLMRATCDKLRSQHAQANPGQFPSYRQECSQCRQWRAALASSPSKPAALNADPPAETSEVGAARISTPTPIQGRACDDKDASLFLRYFTRCDPCGCVDCDCKCHTDCTAVDHTGQEHTESECPCNACKCPCHAEDAPYFPADDLAFDAAGEAS